MAASADVGEEGRIRLLLPWHSAHSNLIRALRDGKGFVVRVPDGTTRVRDDIPRMPQGGKHLGDDEIAVIAAWIDAGCPEHGAE
mgnify:CR=1 FL=1